MAAFPLQLFLVCLKTAYLQKDSFLPSLPSTSYTPVPRYLDDKLVRVCCLSPLPASERRVLDITQLGTSLIATSDIVERKNVEEGRFGFESRICHVPIL